MITPYASVHDVYHDVRATYFTNRLFYAIAATCRDGADTLSRCFAWRVVKIATCRRGYEIKMRRCACEQQPRDALIEPYVITRC